MILYKFVCDRLETKIWNKQKLLRSLDSKIIKKTKIFIGLSATFFIKCVFLETRVRILNFKVL